MQSEPVLSCYSTSSYDFIMGELIESDVRLSTAPPGRAGGAGT